MERKVPCVPTMPCLAHSVWCPISPSLSRSRAAPMCERGAVSLSSVCMGQVRHGVRVSGAQGRCG
eukprot:2638894-Prymnesium_polylepis.1